MSVTSTPHTHVVHYVHPGKSTYYLSPPTTTCHLSTVDHPSPSVTTLQSLTCTCLIDPTPCGLHHSDFSSYVSAVHCEYHLSSPSPIHFNNPLPLQYTVTSLPFHHLFHHQWSSIMITSSLSYLQPFVVQSWLYQTCEKITHLFHPLDILFPQTSHHTQGYDKTSYSAFCEFLILFVSFPINLPPPWHLWPI